MQPNDIIVSGRIALVPLRGMDGLARAFTIIDAEDAVWVNKYRWWSSPEGYAQRVTRINGKKATVFLHRHILGLPHGDDRQGDHINRNKRDNRRSNLRVVFRGQNQQNHPGNVNATSAYRGVSWYKRTGRWIATMSSNGKKMYFGSYTTEEEANAAAKRARSIYLPFAVD